jgi:tetraacyldisaccharide 4'-kinase
VIPSKSLIEFLEAVVYGKRKDPVAAVAKVGLTGLSWLHRGLLRLYMLPLELGIRKQIRMDRPVISVGNITVGGTGKSPTVQFLCKGLSERGWSPAALSYGYGGMLHGRFGIVSDRSGIKLNADAAGDEPVMLASSLPGVPVVVGKHRHISGKAAIDELGADLLVLDDGFQVWKLRRDLDIVLIDSSNPFDNGRLLPAGKLREPLSALWRAGCFIITGDPDTGARNDILAKIRGYTDAPVFFGRFVPSALVSIADRTEMPLGAIRGKKVIAMSSIANPTRFEKALSGVGAVIVGKERFPDHHCYWAEDVAYINRHAMDSDAEIIVTTDKDAVKLDEHDLALPAYALGIKLDMDNESGFWSFVEGALRGNA